MDLLLLVVVVCVGDWRFNTLKVEGRSYQESCEDSPKWEWREFWGSLNTECHWDGRNDDYMASPPRVEAKVTKANLAWREWSCWRRPLTFKWILAWAGDHKAEEQGLPLFPTSYKTWVVKWYRCVEGDLKIDWCISLLAHHGWSNLEYVQLSCTYTFTIWKSDIMCIFSVLEPALVSVGLGNSPSCMLAQMKILALIRKVASWKLLNKLT